MQVEAQAPSVAAAFFEGSQPADLAAIIECLPEGDQLDVFQSYPPGLRARTFAYFEHVVQERLLRELPPAEVANILTEIAPDDRTALLERLPRDESARLIAMLAPEQRTVAEELLHYPLDSVGRLMTPDYVAVEGEWTVKQVLDHIRKHGRDSETLNVVYIVDAQKKLVDDVRIRELLLAPLESKVEDITAHKLVTLKATDDKASAVKVFQKYDRTALPVVDGDGKLVGIVTVDDVLDVAQEEATKDAHQFGGLEALDQPYLTIPLFEMFKKRATWLIILFVGEMATATAMGFFEHEIEKAVVLALFVPLIISSGGNSGSQAATLIIRALAVGEVKLTDWWRVFRREVYAGLLLGATLGMVGFLRIALWSAFSDVYGPHWVMLGITVGFALVGIVLWGTLSGSLLPLVLQRAGLDPATSSAPFVATLVDVTGLVIYFSVAFVVLRGTLL